MPFSHRHTLIDKSADQIWIKDLYSVNGGLVNGMKVSGLNVSLYPPNRLFY